MKAVFSVILISISGLLFSQPTMHNFTVTDSDGNTHRLYEDYLDEGKTVVLKFFFTTCPPCIAIAPQWQQKYVAWGSGDYDVEFFEPSTLSSDTNEKVKTYKTTYNLTMPGIGKDGGAASIVDPFRIGTYGPWYGTPSFAVIAPNRSIQYPLTIAEIDAAIAATGATMPGNPAPSTKVTINGTNQNLGLATDKVKFYIKPKNANSPKIEILKNAQGLYTFDYPSSNVPTMTEPVIIMESTSVPVLSGITAFDIIKIQKHILLLDPFTTQNHLLAGDINNDGKITASDIVLLRKVILGLISELPNGAPAFKSIPSQHALTTSPGNTVNLQFTIVQTGNIN
jgi:thiol-disulfide isomerase/thioredoxin